MATSKIPSYLDSTTTMLNGSSKNLNDYKTTGFYYIVTNVTNAPTTYAWMLVISSGSSSGACIQIVLKANIIYARAFTGDPLAWTNWNKVNLTELT